MEKLYSFSIILRFRKLFLFIIAFSSSFVAAQEDYSNKILLIHTGLLDTYNGAHPITQSQTPNGSYGSSDSGVRYTAEYLKGMLNLTEYSDLEVDYHSVTEANSLADVFYDPKHSGSRAIVGRGYKYVFFFESEQAQVYAEVMYEACK